MMVEVETAQRARECNKCREKITSGFKHFRIYFGRARRGWTSYYNLCERCIPDSVGPAGWISTLNWGIHLKKSFQHLVSFNQELRLKRKGNQYDKQ